MQQLEEQEHYFQNVLKDVCYKFSKDLQPAGYAKDGDIVTFVTQNALGENVNSEETLFCHMEEEQLNAATGPLFVEGAEKGDVLAVDILDIKVDETGVTMVIPEEGGIWDQCEERTRFFSVKNNRVTWEGHDMSWDTEPMIGVIGCAHDEKELPTMFVGDHGGNMDSNIITKGATVWLPVRVKGGLLSIGDLHASMADGEMCGTGIEISGEVVVRVRLLKNFELRWPVTETKDAYYVNTNGETCDKAIERGYKEMARLIADAYGWGMSDVAVYMSVRGMISANQACLGSGNGGNSFRIGTPKVANKRPLIGM